MRHFFAHFLGPAYINNRSWACASIALPAKLAALREARSDEARVYVRADRGLDYGRVMQVVGDVNGAGFKKVALVTDGQAKTPR